MTITKETVPLQERLRGEGCERTCLLKALRHTMYADECSEPTCYSYSRCVIQDSDNFPDGDYELEFEGRNILLSKRLGQYIPRLNSLRFSATRLASCETSSPS